MKNNELIVVAMGLGVWWFFYRRGRSESVARMAAGANLPASVVGGYEAPAMVGGSVATSAGNAVLVNQLL